MSAHTISSRAIVCQEKSFGAADDVSYRKIGPSSLNAPHYQARSSEHSQKWLCHTGKCLARGLAGADFLPAAGAAVGLQDFFAEADGFGGDFHEFVVGYEFDGLLQA